MVSQVPDQPRSYQALGMAFMAMGVSLGITFGLTLGWVFAPIGLTFVALGLIFLNKDSSEGGE